jgi:hypothetical protein
VLETYLDQAQNWESKNGLAAGSVLNARLAPDMLTFGQQFTVTCDKVELHVAKLQKVEPPKKGSVEPTYDRIRQRLADVRSALEKVNPETLETAQSHTYELMPPVAQGWFGGSDYIRHLVLPDFFFHIAIAHAILRNLGAPVGKRDYLGHLTPESGGYS